VREIIERIKAAWEADTLSRATKGENLGVVILDL